MLFCEIRKFHNSKHEITPFLLHVQPDTRIHTHTCVYMCARVYMHSFNCGSTIKKEMGGGRKQKGVLCFHFIFFGIAWIFFKATLCFYVGVMKTIPTMKFSHTNQGFKSFDSLDQLSDCCFLNYIPKDISV